MTYTRTVFIFLKWNKNAIFFNKAIKILQTLKMPSSMFYLFVDKSDFLQLLKLILSSSILFQSEVVTVQNKQTIHKSAKIFNCMHFYLICKILLRHIKFE